MHPGFTKLTYMTDSGSQRLKRKQIRTADDLPINGEERYVSYGEFVPNIPVFVKFPPRPIQNLSVFYYSFFALKSLLQVILFYLF